MIHRSRRGWIGSALIVGLLAVGTSDVAVAHAAASVSGRVDVFVAYADSSHSTNSSPANFPTPWTGPKTVTFEGCHLPSYCDYDTGAVRIVNHTGATVTVNSVAVHVSTCTYMGWPSATLRPDGQLIVTQLGSAGPVPPGAGCTGPAPTHMDTSDVGPGGSAYDGNCKLDGVIPSIDVTVDGATTTYSDTTQVLNTGGHDVGECPHNTNESQQWSRVGPQSPPVFKTTTRAEVTAGAALVFTVRTRANPPATITSGSPMPAGFSLIDNGNGTATLSGASSLRGVHFIVFDAVNVAGSTAQNFELTVR